MRRIILTAETLGKESGNRAGLSHRKGIEVVQILLDRMMTHYAAGRTLHIDGFGVLRKGLAGVYNQQSSGRDQFFPDEALLEAINREPRTPPMEKPQPLPPLPRIPEGRGILPVHPIRHEDRVLLDRWALTRRGIIKEVVSASVIYKTDTQPPVKAWSEAYARGGLAVLNSFARRCRVPLREVGLQDDGLFTNQSLQSEILLYAQDYEARSGPRLEYYMQQIDPIVQTKKGDKGPLAWRTVTWQQFVDHATEFYNWLERQGLRPPGSNPFRNIRRLPAIIRLKGRPIIIDEWYQKILDYRWLTPKQRCILQLLANGLREHEVATARIERINLRQGLIEVIGKNAKYRKVFLFREAVEALDAYLTSRATLASPWLFPRRRAGMRNREHLDPTAIFSMVRRIVQLVFPRDEDRHIWGKISPHKFRHYYVSSSLHKGMSREVLAEMVGHHSQIMLDAYKELDPAWIQAEVRRIDKLTQQRKNGAS